MTDTLVDVAVLRTGTPSTTSQEVEYGAIVRWTDSSNYARATIYYAAPGLQEIKITQVVAGVSTVLASATADIVAESDYYVIRVGVSTSGRIGMFLLNQAKTVTFAGAEASATALATGGALDDGKPGIYDRSTSSGTTVTRYFDNFSVLTGAAEPIVIYSGQSLEVRHDDTVREDSTGTYYGRPQFYRGSRFVVPVGTSRVLVKARRNDIDAATDGNVTDATQIQVGVTSRGLVVPRS
jgi:hypothetical protein